MKKVLVATLIASVAIGMKAGAYIDLGNGQVILEYGDSYGSVAADYDLNYYNLGYYNGQDPDAVVVMPGDVISIGQASAASYYYGYEDETYSSYSYNESYDSGYDYGGYYGGYNDYSYQSDYSEVYGSSYIPVGYDANSGYNANVACQLQDGVEIAPGQTYNIDNYLGDGGYGYGFIDSTCLDGQGGTFQAPGGGICGVSTAIHKAGKEAGLTILRRVPHNNGDGTTGVSYASAEDQAAFNAGGANLIMRNDTGQTVKLSASYDGYGVSAKWLGCHDADNR